MLKYHCIFSAIISDVPKLKGSLTAELHPDLMIFFWPNITGIYSELFIFSCLNLHDNCESLFTTHNSPSHFVVRNPDERTNYFLSIYQGNEEVFRGQFLPKGERSIFVNFSIYGTTHIL